MANLSIQSPGTPLTFVDATSGGDEYENDGRPNLFFQNLDGVAKTVTILGQTELAAKVQAALDGLDPEMLRLPRGRRCAARRAYAARRAPRSAEVCRHRGRGRKPPSSFSRTRSVGRPATIAVADPEAVIRYQPRGAGGWFR